jgi:hypothetical protein
MLLSQGVLSSASHLSIDGGCCQRIRRNAIYAPARLSNGKYDDLTDSATQALKYLRDVGLAQTDEEERNAEIGTVMHRPRLKNLYPI